MEAVLSCLPTQFERVSAIHDQIGKVLGNLHDLVDTDTSFEAILTGGATDRSLDGSGLKHLWSETKLL